MPRSFQGGRRVMWEKIGHGALTVKPVYRLSILCTHASLHRVSHLVFSISTNLVFTKLVCN